MRKTNIVRLTESGIMLAFAVVLSFIKLVDLPFGGSITACSMLPVALIAYRYGTRWGLLTAFAFSLIQLLDGMKNLQYATSPGAMAAIILLDYIVAFVALGLCGLFRKAFKSQEAGLTAGLLLACVIRYLCHVISGCTVWAGISIPTAEGLIYSLAYNATYMVPESLICIVGAIYVTRLLDFRQESLVRLPAKRKQTDLALLFSGLSKLFLAAAAVFDIVHIFTLLQNPETGDFDITGITAANWPLLLTVTTAGIALGVLFALLARRVPEDHPLSLRGLFRALPFAAVALATALVAWLIVSTLTSGDEMTGYTAMKIALPVLGVIFAGILVFRNDARKHRSRA